MSPRRHPPHRAAAPRARAAFTLVELLASIGIIIFILSITIVAFGPALRSAGTRDAARRLRVALDTARIRAIQEGRNVRLDAMCPEDTPGHPKVPEEWLVCPNAGDARYQWYPLPDFVTIRVWLTTEDPLQHPPPPLSHFAITFGPDGTVASLVIGSADPVADLAEFDIRLETTRELAGTTEEVQKERESLYQFIRVTPLTGVIASYTAYDLPAAP